MDNDRFNDLIARIKLFCEERNWSQFHDPKNLALSLQLESSEVLELFQWTKDNQIKPEKSEQISDELADVLYWVIMLGNHYKIDLMSALEAKMDKNEIKYPIEKSYGNSNKYNEL